jgi:hypothetical protein
MEVKKLRVLIFPAGSEIGLEIFNSLKYNLHVELFGASGKSDHAKFIYDEDHYFEDDLYVEKPDFIEKFSELTSILKIDAIFPTHDTIALFLARHRELFSVKILTSTFQTALIAREKSMTYDFFHDFDFCPTLYQYPFTHVEFPVFLKPNIGEGGKGTYLVNRMEDLLSRMKENTDLLACEYLPGEELSVDCFTDKNRDLIFVGPRSRERIQIGISFHSKSRELTDDIYNIAEVINQKIQIRGAWFFQVKRDRYGKFKLMEFAVRQSSTMGVYRQLGVNFALLTLFDAFDIDVTILKNKYSIVLDRCLFNRYKLNLKYNRVYIDFDDTIIVENKVNEIALKYLYQCKNRNIRICLLTKHAYNLDKSLQQYFISKNLFDEIILLNSDDDKAKSIEPEGSIFIDNYFFDRQRVSRNLQIPVFDVDAIDSLMW